MKKRMDAATILKSACLLKQAKNIIHDSLVLVLDQVPKARYERIWKASNGMYGVVHSLESSWVQAVAREIGCAEAEVPFDCPEKALAFFEARKARKE